MTGKTDRKAASAAYKERKRDAGIFAFRAPDGATWVGASPTLGTIENRLRFALRTGGATRPELAAAWARASGEGFVFEVLERLDPDLSDMACQTELKDRHAHWRQKLGASPL